jgi:tetratricopeptide (TPR) repeat protein
MLKRLIANLLPGNGQRTPAHAADTGEQRRREVLRHAVERLAEGRPAEALAGAEAVLSERPDAPDALALAADALLRLDRPTEAALRARAALRHGVQGVDAHMSLARALARLGEQEEAVLAMRQGEDRDPQRADFWNEFGLLHLHLGNLDMARPKFRRAAALDPRLSSPWINLAVLEQRRGSPAAAVPYLKRAIDCNPDDGVAWSNLGLALRDSERLAEAEQALRRAAALRPGHAQTLVNLASVLLDAGRVDAAEASLAAALASEPRSVPALVAAASAALHRDDAAAAAARYREALLHAPDDALALASLGELKLRGGDFERGWDHYEHRFGPDGARRFPYPQWDGRALEGGALLVHAEQGIGDMMLFASCFGELRGVGAVILETPERLAGLFRRSFPWAIVMPYAGDELPRWLDEVPTIAATVPAGSLMRLFRRSASAFPAHQGYLVADPERVAHWRERLDGLGPGPKIGLSWRGGFARTGRQARSIGLPAWQPVVTLPGVHAVSLQYTPEAGVEVAAFNARHGTRIAHWPDAIDDYEETAALVAALDMVVTVCTAAAHLGGALGRPTWILAPAVASWRYLGSGADLPWYPSARVFRQPHGSDWNGAIDAVVQALAARLGLVAHASGEATAAAGGGARPAPATPVAEVSDRDVTDGAESAESAESRARRLVREGDARGAIAALEHLLAERADWADGYALLGRVYAGEGEREPALDCVELALHHDPEHIEALSLACELNDSLGRLDAAIDALQRIIALGSGGASSRVSLARLHYRKREFSEAERIAVELLEENPAFSEALDVLGLARIGMEDYARAVEPLERLLRARPSSTSAQHNLAVAYLHRGRLEEASRLWEWVLAREPNNYDASWHHAFVELGQHRFDRGWPHYERRRHLPERRQITANLPRWTGERVPERKLLVLGEQGLGDEIMFASCLPDALARCKEAMITCDRRLMKLFERSFPGVRVFDESNVRADEVAEADLEVLAGSLPVLFRPTVEAFPRHQGYLKPDPARVAHWRERLAAMGPGRKYALSWRGGTALTRTRLRSLSLGDLLPLLERPDLRFLSLQYGPVEDDIAALREQHGIDLPHYAEVIPDYDETAALVCALDGVVSVCTSIVHLTGALGKPAHVLVPSVAEWRYGVQGNTMPWYPSAVLYRQDGAEPWAGPVSRLAAALGRAD